MSRRYRQVEELERHGRHEAGNGRLSGLNNPKVILQVNVEASLTTLHVIVHLSLNL